MSKSKKNVVGLDTIVDNLWSRHGAAVFLLSDSPPERDLEWTDPGIEGIWRYVNRLWRMVSEPAAPLPPSGAAMSDALAPALTAVRRLTHKTIAAVTDDIDKFRFNRAVARIRELTNALEDVAGEAPGAGAVLREGLEAGHPACSAFDDAAPRRGNVAIARPSGDAGGGAVGKPKADA